MTECIKSHFHNGYWWVSITTGLLFAMFLTWFTGMALVSFQPTEVKIENIRVFTAADDTRQKSLVVDLERSSANNCTSTSQQILYQDRQIDGKNRRYYFPLGSALNGKGPVLEFSLVLALPPLEPGKYQFVQRSAYICEWAGGFITRRIAYQTDPQTVSIPTTQSNTASR
jgi:hypothetical protein